MQYLECPTTASFFFVHDDMNKRFTCVCIDQKVSTPLCWVASSVETTIARYVQLLTLGSIDWIEQANETVLC